MRNNELELRNAWILNEVYNQVVNIAYKNDILITNIEGLSSDADAAFVKDRWINMNPNYNSPIQKSFRLAHEIGHILLGKGSYHSFTDSVDRQEEHDAHLEACKILDKIIYEDTPLENKNSANFMQWFNLDCDFQDIIEEAFYYNS